MDPAAKEAIGAVPAFLQYGALGLLALVVVLVFIVVLRSQGRDAATLASLADLSKAVAELRQVMERLDDRLSVIMFRLMGSGSGQMSAVRPPEPGPSPATTTGQFAAQPGPQPSQPSLPSLPPPLPR
jgi:uncharacterized coiled-coil protein SlyX